MIKKRNIFTCVALFGVLALVGCDNNTTEPVSYIDRTANSPYGKITDFSIASDAKMNVGDILTFKVTPSEDYLIDAVTVNGSPAQQVIGQENTYSWTLVEGVNEISATYKVDATIDFVDEFKLNVSDEDWTHVVNDEGPNGDGYDFRQNGLELIRTQHLLDTGIYSDTSDPFLNFVDGDTTHVETLKYGYTVKIRYLGIDTPESSSDLEEWGKSAAIYNQSCLEYANYILLQSQGRAKNDSSNYASTVDGNGRNLAYVWYSNWDGAFEELPADSFRCLNIEMVYEGFSQGIGSIEDMGEDYYYAFDKANKSAQANERHQYSSERDPNYCYALPQELTLEQIYQDPGSADGGTDAIYKDEKTLYKISGYVTRKLEGAFYFQNYYDYTYGDSDYFTEYGAAGYNEDQLPLYAYGMYVFTYRQTAIQPGDYVSVIGVLTDYGGSYQMSGISYSQLNPNPDRDTIVDFDKSVAMSEIVPISVTADQAYEMCYNNVLVKITDTLYPYQATTSRGFTVCEGGLYEVNKYNTTYPFYNDNNKIIMYADTVPNSTASSYDAFRMVVPDELLLTYNGENAYTSKFFTGGKVYYNTEDANNLNIIISNDSATVNVNDPFKDDSLTSNRTYTYTPKALDIVCISNHYLSTTGATSMYTFNLVSRADVTITELGA